MASQPSKNSALTGVPAPAELLTPKEYAKASPVHYSYRVFPVVVTRSPIVSCSLSRRGNVNLSRIDSCWLYRVLFKIP